LGGPLCGKCDRRPVGGGGVRGKGGGGVGKSSPRVFKEAKTPKRCRRGDADGYGLQKWEPEDLKSKAGKVHAEETLEKVDQRTSKLCRSTKKKSEEQAAEKSRVQKRGDQSGGRSRETEKTGSKHRGGEGQTRNGGQSPGKSSRNREMSRLAMQLRKGKRKEGGERTQRVVKTKRNSMSRAQVRT